MRQFVKLFLVHVASLGFLCRRTFAVQWQPSFPGVSSASIMDSFTILKGMNDGFPTDLGKAASAIGSIVSQVHAKLGAQSQTLPPNLMPFVLVSQEESGLDWMSTLLDSHPDIIIISSDVFGAAGKYDGTLADAFMHETSPVMQKLAAANDTNSTKWLGIKVLTAQVNKIEDGLEMANATFIFHWRRNVLRQLFTISEPQQNQTLPKAAIVGLECNIAHTLLARSETHENVVSSGSHVCPVSHFEDWLAPNTRRQAEQSIFSCLHVAPAELVTPYATVNETLPVLARVANADQIRLLLKNSKYGYMLEEAMAASDVPAMLKASDAFDKQPPPQQGCWWETGVLSTQTA